MGVGRRGYPPFPSWDLFNKYPTQCLTAQRLSGTEIERQMNVGLLPVKG